MRFLEKDGKSAKGEGLVRTGVGFMVLVGDIAVVDIVVLSTVEKREREREKRNRVSGLSFWIIFTFAC